MQKQQQIMMQMSALQGEFMNFQAQTQANPGAVPPAQVQQQMQAFQAKLKELSENLTFLTAVQKKTQEQAMPPQSLLRRPSTNTAPGGSTPNPNSINSGSLPPPRIQVPSNLSGPLPVITAGGTTAAPRSGSGSVSSPAPAGATPKQATITAPTYTAPVVAASVKAPPAGAPKAQNGMLKAGPLLKLGGKKAFGHKWQLRKCCVLVAGDMEWYDADPNDPSHAVFKGKMTLKGAAYKDIDNGHPDFSRLRKIGHKNIPKDNPDFMGFFSLYSSNKNKTYFFAVPMKYRESWKKAIVDVSK